MDKFIKFKTLEELRKSAKDGNELAKNIIDKYMDDKPDMESIARLLNEYYGQEPIPEEPLPQGEEGEKMDEAIIEASADEIEEPVPQEPAREPNAEQPIVEHETIDFDKELDGLIDDEEVSIVGFTDFLNNKKRDGLRSHKGNEYFKAFDKGARDEYSAKKKDEYSHKYDDLMRQSQRAHDDIASSLDAYNEFIVDMPDDGIEPDVDKARKAYDELLSNSSAMSAFGRHWDEDDVHSVRIALESLVQAFGKRNVTMVLNTIRDDNENLMHHNEGRIKHAIDAYCGKLDSLLK